MKNPYNLCCTALKPPSRNARFESQLGPFCVDHVGGNRPLVSPHSPKTNFVG